VGGQNVIKKIKKRGQLVIWLSLFITKHIVSLINLYSLWVTPLFISQNRKAKQIVPHTSFYQRETEPFFVTFEVYSEEKHQSIHKTVQHMSEGKKGRCRRLGKTEMRLFNTSRIG